MNSAALHSGLESSMREGRHAPWTDWLLLILFVGFQVADIASTNYLRGIHDIWGTRAHSRANFRSAARSALVVDTSL